MTWLHTPNLILPNLVHRYGCTLIWGYHLKWCRIEGVRQTLIIRHSDIIKGASRTEESTYVFTLAVGDGGPAANL